MKLLWSSQAEEDLAGIVLFVAEDNPLAALELDEGIVTAVERLTVFPRLGKPGLVPGTRELVVHEHYVVVYTVHADELQILTVLHTSRQWPPQ